MNITQQSEAFLNQLETRRTRKAKPRTLAAYTSYARTWIVPLLGNESLEGFRNAAMKSFVQKLHEADLAPATIVSIVTCLKAIIGSAVNEEGEQIYERKWNNEFADVPVVNPREQNTPSIGADQLEAAIKDAPREFGLLLMVLAGTGLRISEALGLRIGPDDGKSSMWIPEQSKFVVRGQIQDHAFIAPKTESGFREVDVAPVLAGRITGKQGFMFGGDKPLALSTIYDAKNKLGLPGFHAYRRFRITRCREMNVPEDLTRFWVGHRDASITSRYSRLHENVSVRKEWAERAGLGFEIN